MGKRKHNPEANEWRGRSRKRGSTGKDWVITVRRAREQDTEKTDWREGVRFSMERATV